LKGEAGGRTLFGGATDMTTKTGGRRIAVDGGGTHVRAALFAGDREAAVAAAGPVNPTRVGIEAARAALTEALRGLVRLDAAAATVDGACVGLAGRTHPEVAAMVAHAFADAGVTVEGPRLLGTDAELVLWAAFGDEAPSGVVVVAGTGSIAMARRADGGIARSGGYGPVLGDEGAGHWIGVEALKCALRRIEEAGGGRRSRPSGLVDELHEALGGGGLTAAPQTVAKGTLRPSTLAPVVVLAAEKGDRDADDVLRRAGAELAGLVGRAAAAAGLHGPFHVRGAGGVFAGSARVVASLRHELRTLRPEADLGDVAAEPLRGALAMLLHHEAAARRVPPHW
jgi:N-acetylmuramic acid 6-phosphate etherase